MNIYELSRQFWDYCYQNTGEVKPNHIALYFFIIEHCNRLGWKEKFGLPSHMAMEAISIKSHNTFISTLNDLIRFGFIVLHEKSRNQFTSNIIALSKKEKAQYKALDEAMIKHSTKQSESTIQSTVQSIDSIDIPIYQSTNLPINQSTDEVASLPSFSGSKVSLNPPPPEKKKSSAKKEKNLLHCAIIEVYDLWYKKVNDGIPPHIAAKDAAAVKTISAQLKGAVLAKQSHLNADEQDSAVIAGLEYIFNRWETLPPFYQQQKQLCQIASNLTNIIPLIKTPQNVNSSNNNKQRTSGFDLDGTIKAAHDIVDKHFSNK